ncbi:hypothetical protein RHS01_06233 [Rhizoctonia solani]|uniref:LysM domain-containing protein n=1 Tax=Rhizoctonia solani TaxID=456999 RepID=A0A8H7M6A7_9AGAM|nr:hypothetical protein RHS01_06233 [Rhizoctonia solani]
MSDSDISTSTRSSRSRSSTSRSRTASSTFSSTESEGGLDTTTTATFVPTTTPSATGLLTASVPVQTETTSSSSLSASTPISTTSTSDNSGAAGPPVAAIVVPTILEDVEEEEAAGRRTSQGTSQSVETPIHSQRSKTLRSTSHPTRSPRMKRHDAHVSQFHRLRNLAIAQEKLRSSRASSSIFIDDRTTHSRRAGCNPYERHFAADTFVRSDPFKQGRFRPSAAHHTRNALHASIRIFHSEEQDGEKLIAQAQPADVEIISLSRTTTRNSNRSSRSARSKTRNSTPPTPTGLSRRYRPHHPSRSLPFPAYPTILPNAFGVLGPDAEIQPEPPSSLSPDVLATLERLKKRISTPCTSFTTSFGTHISSPTSVKDEVWLFLSALPVPKSSLQKRSSRVFVHPVARGISATGAYQETPVYGVRAKIGRVEIGRVVQHGRDNEAETFILGDSDEEDDWVWHRSMSKPDAVDDRPPTPPKVLETTEVPSVANSALPQSYTYYIKPRDTVTGIALKHGVDPRQLCVLNKLPSSTLTTTPHLLHITRTTLQLPPGSRAPSPPPPDLEQRSEARAKERAGKAFQAITKETDWVSLKRMYRYLKWKDVDERRKRRMIDTRSKEGKQAMAVDRYLDDNAWEEEQRKAGLVPRIEPFPYFDLKGKENVECNKESASGGSLGWWRGLVSGSSLKR